MREGQVTEEILCNPKTLLKHTIIKVEIEITPFVGCCIHPMMRKQPLITPTLKESFAIELETLIDMAISPLAAVWLLIGVVADRYARRAPARSVEQNRHKPYCSVLSPVQHESTETESLEMSNIISSNFFLFDFSMVL